MRELVQNFEAHDTEAEKYDHTITVWKEDGQYYWAKHLQRMTKVNLESLQGEIIPVKPFLGKWDLSLKELTICPPEAYEKRPRIFVTDTSQLAEEYLGPVPGDNVSAEARVLQKLEKHPHRNICKYYGCIREGESIVAICLKRYNKTLFDAVSEKDVNFDPAKVLQGVRDGVEFLHALGLVHNDINPANIMFDDEGNAVIIDFDSCLPEGEKITRKGGTFEWSPEPEPALALRENDEFGLARLSEWLEKEYPERFPKKS